MMDNNRATLDREVWGMEVKVEVLPDRSHPTTLIHINSNANEDQYVTSILLFLSPSFVSFIQWVMYLASH